jgi:hypothetical protein
VYFAPFSGATKAGCTPPIATLSSPEEEWLSRRSHHNTAQRTVPFWTDNADTGTPCTPSLPTFGPGPSSTAILTSVTGEAGLACRGGRSFISAPQRPSVPTHFISNLHTSPPFSKLATQFFHKLITSPVAPPKVLTSNKHFRSSFRLTFLLVSSDAIQS